MMMMMMMAGAGAGVRRYASGLRNLSTQSNRILEDANAKRKKLTLTETLKQLMNLSLKKKLKVCSKNIG